MRALLVWLLALVALTGTPAVAAIPPRPSGPVLDQADILPPADEAALDAKLRAYNQSTGRAIVVATVSSLDGMDEVTYGVKMFEAWGIGGKESDQGLLFLVAPNERRVRFEVGHGLTPYMTDALSGRIIRDTITPRFKAGDMPGGISAGVDAIIAQLNRDPADAKAIAEAAAAAQTRARQADKPGFGGVFFWIVMILVFMSVFGRGRRRGRRFSGGGLGPIILMDALSHMGGRGGGFGGGFGGGGGGGGFGGFGGGGSGGGGASGGW